MNDGAVPESTQRAPSRISSAALIALLAVTSSGLVTGCSSIGTDQPFSYRKTRNNPGPEQVLTYSYTRAGATNDRPFFKEAYATAGPDTEHIRNRILYELMGLVDDYYFRYTRQLRAGIAGKGIFTDSLGIATSLASTAAGGEQVKTILSAISTGVQGVSKSIDANALLGSTVEAIRLQMDATRSSVATEIITKIKEQGVAEYPLEAGLRDIVRYHDAGTITSGVAALSQESARGKQAAEKVEKEKAANIKAIKEL